MKGKNKYLKVTFLQAHLGVGGAPLVAFFLITLSFVVSLCCIPSTFASEIVHVEKGNGSCVLGSDYVDFFEDKEGQLTIEDILQKKESAFQHLPGKTAGFGFTSSTYWFSFIVTNDLPETANYFLKIGYPLLDEIGLYSSDDYGTYSVYQTGDHFPFKQRYLDTPNFVFPLRLPSQSTKKFYLRVQTSSSMTVPMLICSSSYFVEHVSQEKMIMGLFFGILLVMMIHNFFVYVSTAEIPHLYYVLFVASNLLFQFTLNGLTFQFLWPDQSWLTNSVLPILIFCCYLSAAQFSRTFLNSRVYTPTPDKILLTLNYCAVAGIIISPFIGYAVAIKMATLLILTVPLFIYIGIRCLLSGHRSAIYYCLGWGVSLFGYFVFALKSFGVLPEIFLTRWGIQIGSAWEIIFFSVGLADRFQFMKKEREDMQRSHANKIEKKNMSLTELVGRLSKEIGNRRKIEKDLVTSEQTARALINTPLNIAILLDKDGIIVDGNRTFADSLQRQFASLIGSRLIDLYPQNKVGDERRMNLAKVYQTGVMCRFEDCLDGCYFDNTINPIFSENEDVIGVSILSQNITKRITADRARKELEVTSMNQAKMASLGQISTGIAHEINQPLSYIKIIFESMIIDLKENRLDLTELLGEARESLRQLGRITAIISHLRIFGRADRGEMDEVDLVQVFQDSLILMGQRLKDNQITLTCQFPESPAMVCGNQVKLEQICINLLQNSMDAILEKGTSGEIEVKITASPHDDVCFELSDNGVGLDDLGDEIFEPFFTTKGPGSGTGLGLSIIYGIIKEYNGTITCKPSRRGGAIFLITLPRCG